MGKLENVRRKMETSQRTPLNLLGKTFLEINSFRLNSQFAFRVLKHHTDYADINIWNACKDYSMLAQQCLLPICSIGSQKDLHLPHWESKRCQQPVMSA